MRCSIESMGAHLLYFVIKDHPFSDGGKSHRKVHLDVLDAWNRTSRTGKSRLMLVENKQLLDMRSLSDLMQFLALTFDLERGSR